MKVMSVPHNPQPALPVQEWATRRMDSMTEGARHDALHPCRVAEEEGLEEYAEREVASETADEAEASKVVTLYGPPLNGPLYVVFSPNSALDRRLGAVRASRQAGNLKCITCSDSLVSAADSAACVCAPVYAYIFCTATGLRFVTRPCSRYASHVRAAAMHDRCAHG